MQTYYQQVTVVSTQQQVDELRTILPSSIVQFVIAPYLQDSTAIKTIHSFKRSPRRALSECNSLADYLYCGPCCMCVLCNFILIQLILVRAPIHLVRVIVLVIWWILSQCFATLCCCMRSCSSCAEQEPGIFSLAQQSFLHCGNLTESPCNKFFNCFCLDSKLDYRFNRSCAHDCWDYCFHCCCSSDECISVHNESVPKRVMPFDDVDYRYKSEPQSTILI